MRYWRADEDMSHIEYDTGVAGQSVEPQVTREDWQARWEQNAQARAIITGQFPRGRTALYVGMQRDWPGPLAVAEAGKVVAIDVGYTGLHGYTKDDARPIFTDAITDREARAWLVDEVVLGAMQSEIRDVLGVGSKVSGDKQRLYVLQFSWLNKPREFHLIGDSIDTFVVQDFFVALARETHVVITNRTFPSVSAWSYLIEKLSKERFIYTTGFGYGRGTTPWSTISGVGVHNSPLPLYVLPEEIGLRKLDAYDLYEKVKQVPRKRLEKLLLTGAVIDTLVDETNLKNCIAKVVSHTDGQIASFYPRPPEELPVLWSSDEIEEKLTGLIDRAGLTEPARVWARVAASAHRLKSSVAEDPKAIDRLDQEYFETAGYLKLGESLSARLVTYATFIVELAEKRAGEKADILPDMP